MTRIHFTFDKTEKSQSIKKNILKYYKNYTAQKSEVIVVLGGDGFMLQALKKFQKYKKPFYGMNRGSYGFLMNKFKVGQLSQRINKSKKVNIHPLQMRVVTKNNQIIKAIAINEVSLLRQSRQTAYLNVKSNKKTIIPKLICDGILVSTPAGSTAYNLSVHGPILSLDSGKLAITPISVFRPRRWKGCVVQSKVNIKIKNLDNLKRPVSAVADNTEVRNIKNVKININKSIKFTLLYDKNNSLTKKIKLEQLRKITK